MWLNFTTGFYSVVKKPPCKDDEFLVRTHSKDGIEKLQLLLKTKFQYNGKVYDTPEEDYAYHMIVPRKIIANFTARAVNELVHENFKSTKSWDAMCSWQKGLKKAH